MSPLFRTTVRLHPRGAPRDAYATHQAVAAAATGPRILWAQPNPQLLIIQSSTPPDWGRVPGADTAETRPVPFEWPAGTPVTFGLIGNPIRSVGRTRPDGTPNRAPGRRPLPIRERPAWLHRKLGAAVTVTGLQHHPLPAARGRQITLTRHLFTGTGTVTDPARLTELITGGVGAGKGFGCGLLIVGGTR